MLRVGFSLVAAGGGFSLHVAALVAEHRLQVHKLEVLGDIGLVTP